MLPSLKAISTQDNVHIKKHQLLHSSRLKEQKEHVDLHSVKSRPDAAMIKIDGGLLCFISVALQLRIFRSGSITSASLTHSYKAVSHSRIYSFD